MYILYFVCLPFTVDLLNAKWHNICDFRHSMAVTIATGIVEIIWIINMDTSIWCFDIEYPIFEYTFTQYFTALNKLSHAKYVMPAMSAWDFGIQTIRKYMVVEILSQYIQHSCSFTSAWNWHPVTSSVSFSVPPNKDDSNYEHVCVCAMK